MRFVDVVREWFEVEIEAPDALLVGAVHVRKLIARNPQTRLRRFRADEDVEHRARDTLRWRGEGPPRLLRHRWHAGRLIGPLVIDARLPIASVLVVAALLGIASPRHHIFTLPITALLALVALGITTLSVASLVLAALPIAAGLVDVAIVVVL